MIVSRGSAAMAYRLAITAAVCIGASALRADEPLMRNDIAFEHLVDRDRLVDAITALDAESLTDIAIQFSEAERVLLRPHKTIRSDELTKLAVRAAVESRHEAALNRLEGYARQNAKQQLVDEIVVARRFAGAIRSIVDEPLLPIEEVTPDLISLYQEYKEHLNTARIVGDGQLLAGLESSLQNDDNGLPEALRTRLLTLIADSRATIPVADSAWSDLYSVLIGPSRGTLNQSIVSFCRSHLGRRVGDGECATLVTAAFKSISARRFPPHGPDADYVWGSSVYGLEVSGGLEVEDGVTGAGGVQPGDIIQFHNASFKGQQVNADGSRRTWTSRYTHHTAVIASANGRRWTVFHQNVGPQGKSEDAKRIVQIGRINLNELDSGWLKVYRPVSVLSGASRADGDSVDNDRTADAMELLTADSRAGILTKTERLFMRRTLHDLTQIKSGNQRQDFRVPAGHVLTGNPGWSFRETNKRHCIGPRFGTLTDDDGNKVGVYVVASLSSGPRYDSWEGMVEGVITLNYARQGAEIDQAGKVYYNGKYLGKATLDSYKGRKCWVFDGGVAVIYRFADEYKTRQEGI